MPLPDFVEEFDRTEVDEAPVRQFERNTQYFDLAFNLFRETAQWVCLLANTTVGDRPTWDVSPAVYGGHLVRMFKLMCCLLEEAIKNRAEFMWIVIRLLAECVINFRFLVEKRSEELIRSYLMHSLQHERELRDRITANVEVRNGKALPIERRMLASIERTFANSRIAVNDLPDRRIRNWGNKSLFQKAKAVGLGDAYLSIFGGPSRNVHGGWQDLLQHHLECKAPGEFAPRMEFTAPRPQPIFALSCLIVRSLIAYIGMLGHPDIEPAVQKLRDLIQRVELADELHEDFLATRSA